MPIGTSTAKSTAWLGQPYALLEVRVHVQPAVAALWTELEASGVSSRWARALRLGALAGGLVIGAFGPIASSSVAAPTTMVDLGDASTYAVLERRIRRQHRQRSRRPAHHAPGRPRCQGEHAADRLSPRDRHRRDRRRQHSRHPGAQRPRRGLQRGRRTAGRRRARGRAGGRDRHCRGCTPSAAPCRTPER